MWDKYKFGGKDNLKKRIERIQKAADRLPESSHKEVILGDLDAIKEEIIKPLEMSED